jgi:DNA-binding LacI/PurR family transcriptional regulator
VQVLLLDHTSTNGWEKADGVLVCDWSAHDIMDRVPGTQPCVSVLVDLPGLASVTADDYQGGRLATQYLLQQGHRRIAYLHGMDVNTLPVRMSGYRDALAEAGMIPDGRWTQHLTGYFRTNAEFEERAQDAMSRWFGRDWDKHNCTAVLCHNDATALGAIRALRERGMRVPEDVSVIGFDAAESTPLLPGGLTSVEVPLQEIGRKSVEVLLRQIEADDVRQERHVFPTKIKSGVTTAPVSTL